MQFSFATLTLALVAVTVANPILMERKTSSKTTAAAAAGTAIAKASKATEAAAAGTANAKALKATAAAATGTASAKASKATAAAKGATGATGASVLTAGQTYNAIQISGGTAGSAQTEANALFAKIDQTNLAGVSAADLKIIKATHDAAEDAEVKAFNPAVAAATGDAATAIQNGKIKNKVLKLTAEVLGLQIEAAQGKTGGDVAAEQTKLTNNIALDTKAAGQASTAEAFDATIG